MIHYEIYYKDTLTGYLDVSDDKKTIIWDPMDVNPLMLPFHKDNLTITDVYSFFKDRCYEDGRANLPEILMVAGMTSNDPYEWVKKTHGVTWEDFWWIKEKGEKITWKDVKVRD